MAGLAAALAALAMALLAPQLSAGGTGLSPGSPRSGDAFFPRQGNGGYDVQHYSVDNSYAPGKGRLRGATTIEARATQGLSRFYLDLRQRMQVTSVTVDGQPAAFRHRRAKLAVTPEAGIPDGQPFTAVVSYAGRPRFVIDPDGAQDGWVPTGDGAFVADEPQGAPTWLPCNDRPDDKASFEFRITVPRGLKVVANGSLEQVTHTAAKSIFSWSQPEPMAVYLATTTIGSFRFLRSTVDGLPSIVAIDPEIGRRAPRSVRRTAEILDVFSRAFGPYPFGSTGAILDSANIGYALETQTRPIYDSIPSEHIHAHELAHQWFGDAVTLRRWPEIWLNEGFATWASWLWAQHLGDTSLRAIFRRVYGAPESKGFWSPPPAKLGNAKHLFDASAYVRGAMTLEALREKIGNPAFFTTLKAWVADHLYGVVSTDEFIALAEQQSGRQLDKFFRVWLKRPGKPKRW